MLNSLGDDLFKTVERSMYDDESWERKQQREKEQADNSLINNFVSGAIDIMTIKLNAEMTGKAVGKQVHKNDYDDKKFKQRMAQNDFSDVEQEINDNDAVDYTVEFDDECNSDSVDSTRCFTPCLSDTNETNYSVGIGQGVDYSNLYNDLSDDERGDIDHEL